MKRRLHRIIRRMVILCYRLMCRLLPVQKNKVVFNSSLGKSYAGNPKYIYEHLVKKGDDLTWDIVWFYENTPYEIPGRCRQVRYGRMRYLYEMATAKVWIFDSRQPEFLIRRKNTCYIQTWHGTPLKKLALDMEAVFMADEGDLQTYKEKFAKNAHTWDCLISQNAFSSRIFCRAFDFHGEMLEIGYPRNDILFRENHKESIAARKKKLGLPQDKKILLYAPTWRDDEYSGNQKYDFRPQISFSMLQKELGKDYVMIVKYHYLIMDAVDWSQYEGFVYAFDQSCDIAELYLVADMLITDYSSVMFDFSLLKRPMFFYVYDLEKYQNRLRGFYFDLEKEAPGPLSKTTGQLIQDIRTYRAEEYRERYRRFSEKYNSADDGNAAEKIRRRIRSAME